ncbi:MAG: alanine racemase [Clostridia bacterium]|nr:alanine racemase [Clostridia bacterium]
MTYQPRAAALIHVAALKHNYEYIRSRIKPGTKLCAMVKADAYGHGAVCVARRLEKWGVDYFGVATMSEALEIRNAGVQTPILLMGYTPPEEMHFLWERDLTQTVFSLEYAQLLQQAGGRIRCHLKLDTGMSRLGFVSPSGTATPEMLRALQLDHLDYEGVYTHFALSDEPQRSDTAAQFENFTRIVDDLQQNGHSFALRHASNSGAVINFPQMNLDMVRAGIMLYGLSPDGRPDAALQPVMELVGTVESVKRLDSGSAVSYGATHVCEHPTTVAAVSLGYADGVSRALSNRGSLCVAGQRAPILGKVCMDHLMIDVTHLPQVQVGMPAYLIGGGSNGVTADELAELEGTISYEIVCRFSGRRVPRVPVE